MADDLRVDFTSLHQLNKAINEGSEVQFEGRKFTYKGKKLDISKLASLAKELAKKEAKLKPNETAANFNIVMDKLKDQANEKPRWWERIPLLILNSSLDRTAKAIDKAAKSEDKEIERLTKKAERLLRGTKFTLQQFLDNIPEVQLHLHRQDKAKVIERLRILMVDKYIKEINHTLNSDFTIVNEINNKEDFKNKYEDLMNILRLNKILKENNLEIISNAGDLETKLQKALTSIPIRIDNVNDILSMVQKLKDNAKNFLNNIEVASMDFTQFTKEDIDKLEFIFRS